MDALEVLRQRLGPATPALAGVSVLAQVHEHGTLRPQLGVLRAVIQAQENGHTSVFVAKSQQEEAAIVSGMNVYGVQTLDEIIAHLMGQRHFTPIRRDTRALLQEAPPHDYANIIEDENAKHAIEIAAIDHHRLVLYY